MANTLSFTPPPLRDFLVTRITGNEYVPDAIVDAMHKRATTDHDLLRLVSNGIDEIHGIWHEERTAGEVDFVLSARKWCVSRGLIL